MKILLDLQSTQTPNSRSRGVGRYSMSLAQAMATNCRDHDIHVALNSAFPDTIESLRAAFGPIIGDDNIHVWSTPRGVDERSTSNQWKIGAGEIIREAYIARLRPDIVHVFNAFEGFIDDSLFSIDKFGIGAPTSATLYDLIPLIYGDVYRTNPKYNRWYQKNLDNLKRAQLILAISESSRREGIEWLNLQEEWVVSTPAAADAVFKPLTLSPDKIEMLRRRFGLDRPFIMNSGGGDSRKNLSALVAAYGQLPEYLRKQYQLAIVSALASAEVAALSALATQYNLSKNDVVFTGFVSDEDMVALYGLSTVFVFPSLHEGFGLPVLEAMQCGAPVIGSNCSSLPEVIGRTDALFNPRDEADISAKIFQVLNDSHFRQNLSDHGLARARQYDWGSSARIALDALERLHASRAKSSEARVPLSGPLARPTLAYVSPLPPIRSGIADYSAELLTELTRHYKIDVIVDQGTIEDTWINANCGVKDIEWFKSNGSSYDRVLYHFGNNQYHVHMFDLLERHPGVVVLHDFFISGIIGHMEWHYGYPGFFIRTLWESHGYEAIRAFREKKNVGELTWDYPLSRNVIEQAVGVIVHSEYSRGLARKYYNPELLAQLARVPFPRKIPIEKNRKGARQQLGLKDDDFVICSFGFMGETKRNLCNLEAWLASALAKDAKCHLVFVGQNDPGPYGQRILKTIHDSGAVSPINITGFVTPELYKAYLEAADVAVQLRANSRGETSAAIHDCLAYAIPTVINLHGSSCEVPTDCAFQLPDLFTNDELRDALERMRSDQSFCSQLGENGHRHIRQQHNPRVVADLYKSTIEDFFLSDTRAIQKQLGKSLRSVNVPEDESADWLCLAECIAVNHPVPGRERRLFVDVTELARNDAKTGIQRVVRSIVSQLLAAPPAGYRVEPVYSSKEHGYLYACRFTAQLLGFPPDGLRDVPVEVQAGDKFLGLDYVPHSISHTLEQLRQWRSIGVEINYVLYDILAIRHPEWFYPGAYDLSSNWIEAATKVADGIVCISKTVANDLIAWLGGGTLSQRIRPLRIGWWHLGSDISASLPSSGRAQNTEKIIARLSNMQMIMMVGTLEPRKGHLQVLEAFEVLWGKGIADCLVIVGKVGWMIEGLVNRIRKHPELGHRLFWFESASDDMLIKLYEEADGIVMASQGEGFGLPLVEAAQHGKPILARDLPVFREISGDAVRFFSGESAGSLAIVIDSWLAELRNGTAPNSASIKLLSWEQSTQRLLDIVVDNKSWHACLNASPRVSFGGGDGRFHTQVGVRRNLEMETTGRPGYLLYGPYMPLSPGRYLVNVSGRFVSGGSAKATIDAAICTGSEVLGTALLERSSDASSLDVTSSFTFELKNNCSDFEVRILVSENTNLIVSNIEINPIKDLH